MSSVGPQLFRAHRLHGTDITGNFQIGTRVSAGLLFGRADVAAIRRQ
jgi:hypothetical protein